MAIMESFTGAETEYGFSAVQIILLLELPSLISSLFANIGLNVPILSRDMPYPLTRTNPGSPPKVALGIVAIPLDTTLAPLA